MAEQSPPARLWYQSFVHPVEQAPYIERLQALLDAAASPGVRFEVHGLDPPDHLFHPLTEFRCAAQRNSVSAWKEWSGGSSPCTSKLMPGAATLDSIACRRSM